MSHAAWFLMQVSSDDSNAAAAAAGKLFGGLACCFGIFYLAFIVLIIAGMWKVFTKAGHPGWAAIVPFYNAYILCLIAGKPGWWFILLLIFPISIIFVILIDIEIAKNFGKGGGYAVGLILFPYIFFPMLGFGKAIYLKGTAGPGFPVGYRAIAYTITSTSNDF